MKTGAGAYFVQCTDINTDKEMMNQAKVFQTKKENKFLETDANEMDGVIGFT